MSYHAPLTIVRTYTPSPAWTLHVGTIEERTDGRFWVVEYHNHNHRIGTLGYERRYFHSEAEATAEAEAFGGTVPKPGSSL